MAKQQFEEYEVIYDWEAENEDDLSLFSGEVILVKEKHDHGWWFGVIERDGILNKGHFPKNYVKDRVNAPPRPPPPQRPLSVKQGSPADALPARISRLFLNSPAKEGVSFCLRSLAAYDELTEYGVTLEIENFGGKKAASEDERCIGEGMRIEIDCVGMWWDGSAVITREFARGTLCFTSGKSQVTEGLDCAIQRLKVGESALITCAPSKAYGSAGNPPDVAPETIVIYKVKVNTAVVDTVDAGTEAVGPAALLGTGVEYRINKAAAAPTKKGGVVFVGNKVDVTQH